MKMTTSMLAMVVASLCCIVMPTQAASWYWFGNDTTVGGDGAWNFTDVAWRTHPTDGIFTNWVAGNVPIFSGDPGTVTLESDIPVSQSMNVSANMTFDGPFCLQLSAGTHVTSASSTATVNCAVQLLYNASIRYNYLINGNISDDGNKRSINHHFDTLTLNGSNSFGGGVLLNGGTLVIGNDHALGTGNLNLGYDGAVLKAGDGASTVTNVFKWNWNWRLNFEGDNDLTCTATQTLAGTAAPWPRVNVAQPQATLTYGGFTRDTRFDTMMIKEGPGTFAIQGAYDASFGTVVTGGTLIVNGITTAPKNNYGYTVWPDASLGGMGTINMAASGSTCSVYQAGALAPGTHRASSRVGTLTFNGPVNLNEGAVYKWDCQDGVGDLLKINGTLSLPAVATVVVSQISGELPDSSVVMTANALTGPGATDVSDWNVQGVRSFRTKVVDNTVVLERFTVGTVFKIR